MTSLLDPFAGIKLIDAVIPFTGSYRPIWLGLGAFASDLFIAVALTSVIRRRLGHGAWRATHWLAYVCWPVAIVHTVGTGSDVKQIWLLALTATCVAAVVARGVGADRVRLARAAAAAGGRAGRVDRAPGDLRRVAAGRAARQGLGGACGHAGARPAARQRDHDGRQQRRQHHAVDRRSPRSPLT